MNKVKIITDSSTAIPKHLCESLGIEVLPLLINWGDKSYRDGIDIEADEFYKRLAASETIPSTSQVSAFDFERAYRKGLDEGFDLLVMPMSKEISGSYASAMSAKEAVGSDRVQVVDTKLVSMPLTMMVLPAARAAAAGEHLQDVKALAESLFPRVGVYFIVPTLKYLAANGRINTAKRLVGTMLSIMPLLSLNAGKIDLVESVRGEKKAVNRMFERIHEDTAGRSLELMSVFHAGVPLHAADLQARMNSEFKITESVPSIVSPMIGCHVGPGTVSITWLKSK